MSVDPEIAYVKIHIPSPEEDPGICRGESVWAIDLGDSRYKLQNAPLTPGLLWGDIVSAELVTRTEVIPFRKMAEESNAKVTAYMESRQRLVDLIGKGLADADLLEDIPVMELEEPREDVIDTWEILRIDTLVLREMEIWQDAVGKDSCVVPKHDPLKEQILEGFTEPQLVKTFEATSPDIVDAVYQEWAGDSTP